MEIRVILTPEEQRILGVEDPEVDEGQALSVLFDATRMLQDSHAAMETLRGHEPSMRAELNSTWHRVGVLSGVVEGLKRVVGSPTET